MKHYYHIVVCLFLGAMGYSVANTPVLTNPHLHWQFSVEGEILSLNSDALFSDHLTGEIDPEQFKLLDDVVDYLKRSGASIIIRSHTDKILSSSGRYTMGQRQAKAVATYLVLAGIPTNRLMDVNTRCADEPLYSKYPNWKQRRCNRRIDIMIKRKHASQTGVYF